MARSIQTIEKNITDTLKVSFKLSTSKAAEWKTWVHCIASAIYLFELILDAFKTEMDKQAETMYTGSLTWYNDICYKFQYGYELIYNENTGRYGYSVIDETAQIIKIATVSAINGTLVFKVATMDADGNIIPLSDIQLIGFRNFLDVMAFAGTKISVISTNPDSVVYELIVYYDPATPLNKLENDLSESLNNYKISQKFGGVIYRHKFIEAITRTKGVITAKVNALKRKGAIESVYIDIDTRAELYAGYFDYSPDCVINYININEL